MADMGVRPVGEPVEPVKQELPSSWVLQEPHQPECEHEDEDRALFWSAWKTWMCLKKTTG